MDVIPPIRTPREDAQDAYLSYLQSPTWRTKRNAALKRARFRCGDCGSKRGLQVHHLTYARLGAEWDDDLKVLCVWCHEGRHPEHASHEYLGLYLKIANEVLTDDTRLEDDADLLEDLKRRCSRLKIPYRSDKLGRALEIVRQRLPRVPLKKRAVDGYLEARWQEPISAFEARQMLGEMGRKVLEKMQMPDATPLTRKKADAMLALKQVMAAIADQAHRCDELENADPTEKK